MSITALNVFDYKLITCEILYHIPDYPKFLQTFIWQEYDLYPKFPELKKFLNFWENNIEGKLHSVKIAEGDIIKDFYNVLEFKFE